MDDAAASLRLTRYLDAAPADVWSALTDPASVSRWLGTPAVAALAGRARTVEPGRVLEVEWNYPGEPPSIVRFELVPDEEGTMLVLDHRRLDERLCMTYAGRWERSLDRLDMALATAAATP